MPKRTSSSGWTGTFMHRADQHQITSDYHRLLQAECMANAIPSDLDRVKLLALMVLPSPILLWFAWLLVGLVARDEVARDNSHLLMFSGSIVVVVAAWQAGSRAKAFIQLRRCLLWTLLGATIAAAVAYAYLGINSHSRAIVLPPERTFELVKTEGRRIKRTIIWHQRANGSTVEGFNEGRPLAYSSVCALVQRLDGPYGFSWVRVLERSRPPGRGQLSWPVRREDCFSHVPIASLPR